ncbi:hypothetical protein MTO96_042198 [Rhipicephalus appendiculatus]
MHVISKYNPETVVRHTNGSECSMILSVPSEFSDSSKKECRPSEDLRALLQISESAILQPNRDTFDHPDLSVASNYQYRKDKDRMFMMTEASCILIVPHIFSQRLVVSSKNVLALFLKKALVHLVTVQERSLLVKVISYDEVKGAFSRTEMNAKEQARNCYLFNRENSERIFHLEPSHAAVKCTAEEQNDSVA